MNVIAIVLVLVSIVACKKDAPVEPKVANPTDAAAAVAPPPPAPDAPSVDAPAAADAPAGDTELLAAAVAYARKSSAPKAKLDVTLTVREGGFAQLAAALKGSKERAMVFMKW